MCLLIDKERRRLGLSGLELARRARIEPGAISLILRGLRLPPSGSVWRTRLAEAVGWPVERADELFQDK